jgi:hypothetical protein
MVGTRRDARRYAEQLYHILSRVHSRRQIMITSGLFATRTQIGKRIELLLKNRPLAPNGRKLPASVFLALFAALALSLGAEITPQADPHDVYIKSGGDRDRTVTATITEHDGNAERTITITTRGDVEFNKRRTDVESVSEGGEFLLVSIYDGEKRELRVTADDEGNLERVYEVGGKTHTFDDDAGEWLADCLDRIEGDDDFIMISKPGVRLYKGKAHPSKIRVEVIEPPDPPNLSKKFKMIADGARVLTVTRDDDESETVNIFIHEDDGNSMILRSDGNTLRARDGRLKLEISPDTKVLIQIDRDGDVHQLEIRLGKNGKREYLYKKNGEKKPYDHDAKEIFEDYIDEYEDFIGIPKGEKI